MLELVHNHNNNHKDTHMTLPCVRNTERMRTKLWQPVSCSFTNKSHMGDGVFGSSQSFTNCLEICPYCFQFMSGIGVATAPIHHTKFFPEFMDTPHTTYKV